MMNATIIYGSDTGAPEYVIENYLKDILEIYFELDCVEVNSIEPNIWNTEDLIIIGLSTWYDGILQSDWDDYFDEFKEIDFAGKTVALFGLGDQVDMVNILLMELEFLQKKSLKTEAKLLVTGLVKDMNLKLQKLHLMKTLFMVWLFDEDNQDELSYERVKRWVLQIQKEYQEKLSAKAQTSIA